MKTSFTACGRARNLFHRKPGGPWHVRFNVGGKDKLVSLAPLCTAEDLPAAKERAKRKIEDYYAARDGDTAAAERLSKRKFCTMGDLVDAYQPDPRDVSPETAVKVRSSFLLLVREGAGLTNGSDPRQLSAELLRDGSLIEEFKRRRKLAMRGLDLDAQESAARTINSTIAQARSLVSAQHLPMYAALRLPDLSGFRAALKVKVDGNVSFVPFPAGTIERIEALMESMPRDLYLATLLMLRVGMRNKEVQFAKWEWFRRFQDGSGAVEIKRRPYFKTKNGTERVVELTSEVVAWLAPFWTEPNEWVIAQPAETGRFEVTHHQINAALRPILPDRIKCAYELRKHAGSQVYTATGNIGAAAKFLGDTVQTTEKHYASFLGRVRVPSAAQLRASFSVVQAA